MHEISKERKKEKIVIVALFDYKRNVLWPSLIIKERKKERKKDDENQQIRAKENKQHNSEVLAMKGLAMLFKTIRFCRLSIKKTSLIYKIS